MRPERGQRPERQERVPDAAVRSELENVLASDLFSRSERLSAFLRFVVDETLNGRGDVLKEAVLAHRLYGKDADFDGASSPIVRVDARRLRDKLREYYAGATADPVVISLPKGSYVPAFEFMASPIAVADVQSPAANRPSDVMATTGLLSAPRSWPVRSWPPGRVPCSSWEWPHWLRAATSRCP
jgi:hypothetical protein